MYNLFILLFSADHLSMETLLSMTSKRAGEWFKEELRELGGLDHLVRTSSDCLNFLVADEISMWTEPLHNKLRKTGRVLKVLESVSFCFNVFLLKFVRSMTKYVMVCILDLTKWDLWGLGAESWLVVTSYALTKMIPPLEVHFARYVFRVAEYHKKSFQHLTILFMST